MNSIAPHSSTFGKVSLLQAYNCIHKYDIILSLETYLYLSVTLNESSLYFGRYKMIYSDHPNSMKWREVCIYCKGSLPVTSIAIPCLDQGLLLKINTQDNRVNIQNIQDDKCLVACFCRSPNQTNHQFENFL